MLPTLQIGPLAVQLPGLLLLAGLWLGLQLAERHSHRHNLPAAELYNLVFTALIAGITGARLIYALRYFSVFAENPLSLFSLNPGLLDLPGGIVAGALAATVYGQKKGLRLGATLAALVPVFAALSVAFGLARLSAGTGFGNPTTLPWGIELWGEKRHPTQLYDTLLAAGILIAVWPGGKLHVLAGERIFLVFTALTALAYIFVEAFRAESPLLFAGIRLVQVAAWLVLAASLWGLGRRQAGNTALPSAISGDVRPD